MRFWFIGALVFAHASAGLAADAPAKSGRTLKILSNNVGVFPKHIVAFYPDKLKEKKKEIIADEEEQAAAMARALLAFDGDPDVVLLQEIWSIKARDRLIKDLASKYPHFKHPPPLGSGAAALQASGLVMFSKWPLEDFAFKPFTAGFGGDKLARKGIAGARLTKDSRSVAVFTTHLQAGGKKNPSVKPDQLRECDAFIRQFVGGRKDTVVVLAGDFNIRSTDKEDYESIFARLAGARDSFKPELGQLTSTTRNDKQPDKRIDYLLTFGDAKAESTIVDPAGSRVADHLAVFGTIALE